MRRILLIMMALALVIGLTPASIVGAPENDTDKIYGITSTGHIYEIDPLNGTETLVAVVDECPVGGSGPNGLAYDQSTNLVYYTEYPDTDDPDLSGEPDGKTSLYFIDLGTGTETFAGLMDGEIACADIYQGHYYYIAGGANLGYTDDLYKVELLPDGTIGETTVYPDISGARNSEWGFWGDIAIQDGVIYGTGFCFNRGEQEFFQVNIDGSNFQYIRDATASLQLAFGLDGQLYGHIFTDGRTWKVDWTSGATPPLVTFLFTATYRYTDLASGKTSTIEPELYDLCGFKYADWEGDLIPLSGWSIQLYALNATAGDWALTATTTTDENGKYCFTDLPAGTYRVSETVKDGWDQVFPDPKGAEGGAHVVVLPGGQTYAEEDIILYGTQRNNPGNNGLYEINLTTETATRLFNTGGSGNSPNGLGFDPDNGRLYYMKVTEPNGPSILYFYDLDAGTETAAGLVSDEVIVGASFYDGAYYYIPNLTADLHKVTLMADGTVDQDIVLWANFNGDNPAVYRFGDFAISRGGMLYASTNDTDGSTAEFFKLDVATGEYTLIADKTTPDAALLLQVSFGSDGVLYAHAAGTGEFFTVDLQTGVKASSAGYVESDLRDEELFSDLASGTQPKYYNFINTPEQWCGDQTAWAAEKHPGETRFSNANNWATYVGYTKGSGNQTDPVAYPLYAGQHYLAGMLYVYDEVGLLYVRYTTEIPEKILEHCLEGGGKVYQREGYCAGDWTGFLEYHLAVADEEDGIPRTTTGRNRVLSNPIPGNFEYKGYFDPAKDESGWIAVDISELDADFVIAAHAVMQWCGYDCEALEEIEAALQP